VRVSPVRAPGAWVRCVGPPWVLRTSMLCPPQIARPKWCVPSVCPQVLWPQCASPTTCCSGCCNLCGRSVRGPGSVSGRFQSAAPVESPPVVRPEVCPPQCRGPRCCVPGHPCHPCPLSPRCVSPAAYPHSKTTSLPPRTPRQRCSSRSTYTSLWSEHSTSSAASPPTGQYTLADCTCKPRDGST